MRNGAVEEFIFIANEAYLRLQTFTEITQRSRETIWFLFKNS